MAEVKVEDLDRSESLRLFWALRRPSRNELTVYVAMAASYVALIVSRGVNLTVLVAVAAVAVPLFIVLDARNLDRTLASVPPMAKHRVVVRAPDAGSVSSLLGVSLTGDQLVVHHPDGTTTTHPQSEPPTVWVSERGRRTRQIEAAPFGRCAAWSQPSLDERPRIER